MIAIPFSEHSDTVTIGFRKAPRFLLIEDEMQRIVTNPCRRDKSAIFFAWFDTLGVERIYIKNIGLKTFAKLQQKGIDVFILPPNTAVVDDTLLEAAKRLNEHNASQYCTMGHR